MHRSLSGRSTTDEYVTLSLISSHLLIVREGDYSVEFKVKILYKTIHTAPEQKDKGTYTIANQYAEFETNHETNREKKQTMTPSHVQPDGKKKNPGWYGHTPLNASNAGCKIFSECSRSADVKEGN
jgi:hypothetical protein